MITGMITGMTTFHNPAFTFPLIYKSSDTYGKLHNMTAEKAHEFAMNHRPFTDWLEKLSTNFCTDTDNVEYVNVHEVFPFSPTSKAGFIFANACITRQITREDGTPGQVTLSGAAFLRGGAVAIMVILQCAENPEESYVVTTVQPRVPIGIAAYEEIPAGMLDGSSNFTGVAAKEIAEETGLTITTDELVALGQMDPSAGGCDEVIRLFQVTKTMSAAKIAEMSGKLTGLIDEGETITLRIRLMHDFTRAIRMGDITDAKAACALTHMLLRGDV